jgi:Fe-S cluster assembly scaffold protein SufB
MESMLDAYRQAGGNPDELNLPEVATLVVSGSEVLASHEVPGVSFTAEPLENGVRAHIVVEAGTKVKHPIHLCFGVIPAEGVQEIISDYEIGAGAEVQFLAHCSFPNAVKVEHRMDARIHVGQNASLSYTEEHYHGQSGGVEVRPRSHVQVDDGGKFTSTFNINRGRVGLLDLDYTIDADENAMVELVTKAYGKETDQVKVQELLRLNGPSARGLTRTRIAVRDQAVSHVNTVTEGNAAGARGHMDCTEIVRGEAVASNSPLVVVRNPQAQVTHEAAIGTVNRKELEALMARGLDEDESVDLIIRGMIR